MSQWTLTSPTSWRIVITLITRASTSHVDDGDDGLEYVEDDELPFASASVTPPEGHLTTQPITLSEQSPVPSRTPPTPEHDVAPERPERLTTVQPESPIPPPLPEIEDNDVVSIRQPSLPPIAFLPQPASPPIKEQSPTPSTEEMDTQLTSDFGRMDVSLDLDKRESLTPPPFTPTAPPPDLSAQDAPISLPPKPPKAPRPPNLPDRCPTPPPKERPLGPASQYPYLPYDSEYGGPDIQYSCRPNGPKLYDLLATLPMDRFGVLSWLVVDREEDIYEIPDISDESKVMHALWARWMMLSRPIFVEDYFAGTVAFIDEYWRIIHRAAGWDALRYYLLILVAGRFLNLAQVARALKHYEHLIGMEFWEN
ncbi:hypothetical protein ONZ45_g3643 [Pleurotus djamor]|nr:hypothetical protein ONZ45_g3643 [Pleurotus djamor]